MRLTATFGLVYLFAVAFAAPMPQLVKANVKNIEVGENGSIARVPEVRVSFVNRMVISQFTLSISLLQVDAKV